jgi:hypothetical protein
MAFTPTYGSVFVYGAAEAPDRVRLSGPSSASPVGDDPWYGDSPQTDPNGTPYRGSDFGEPVDEWNATSQPGLDPIHGLGYPAGPVDSSWVPNKSWLYGVPLVDGTYTRVAKLQWSRE